MRNTGMYICIFVLKILIISTETYAQNPVIRDQFSADPSARVFENGVYIYPSHDIPCGQGQGRIGFCMADYHVFSSSDLTDWIDHGVIVSQESVKWVDSTSYSLWAPDCIYNNGKYYFYFPAKPRDTTGGKRFLIGVAISDNPDGPFHPQPEPIKKVRGIDPNVFIDKDGQAYLYWSARKIFVASLKENMLELASEPQVIDNLPTKGLIEGPYVFERNGIYYLTYPHVENNTERLEYAMGKSPLGPFKVTGVIMNESPAGCWTNHHSIIEFNDQWYLFYHHNDYSPHFDKNRSVCIDSLFFNDDGTIRKVTPSLRGVGITRASQKIEIDRYSSISSKGASIAFLDSLNTFEGWKAILDGQNAWIQYNAVYFENEIFKKVQVKVTSQTGGIVQIRLDKPDGILISEIQIPVTAEWNISESDIASIQPGIHNLVVVLKDNNPVDIDWIRFLN